MIEKDLDGQRYFELLKDCSLFRTYQDAFQVATGLPLLLTQGGCSAISGEGIHSNSFCQALNEGRECSCCIDMTIDLAREAKEGPVTMNCFAGFKESMVPIHYAGRPVAFLKTGEVLDHEPQDEDFEHIAGVLLAEGRSARDIRRIRKAYFESPVLDGARYDGMIVLLSTFGKQLGEHLKDLVVSKDDGSPPPVQKALNYIERHLDEHLGLDDVATVSGLSVSQFCKVFKEATGTTFTEYVNRRRVDWARRELLRPGSRVTEIAYKVGFASLSQFNRSFLRFVGEAPRSYRKRRLVEVA